MFNIEEELKKLPAQPGVYIMHDARDAVIYVGKAVNLKNRVRQYFQTSRNKGPKIERMVTLIARFEYIVTDSEMEALVLECNLIKEHRPRYNTMLKDDKSYPYIRVTVGEDFPRVLLTRNMKKDRSRYFGPYTNVGAVRDMLDLLRRTCRIRTCSRVLPRDIGKDRPCLNYHIGQCQAPCAGCVTREAYAANVESAISLLSGRCDSLIADLTARMQTAAAAMDFEKAAEYRDLIGSVREVVQKQKMTSGGAEDRDIVAMARDERTAVVQVFFVREGRMIGRDHFRMSLGAEEKDAAVLGSFVKQFYAGTPFLPREVFIQEEPEEAEVLEQWLTARKGQKVRIVVPKRGEKEKLVELAARNAQLVLSQDSERSRREELRTIGAMNQIAGWLGLTGVRRMEAFDISHISGSESVGSMVVFENGRPKRSDYRKFKIRTVSGPNDIASMKEVLTRRFSHGLREKSETGPDGEFGRFTRFPDLLMMDGGKAQVNIALEVLAGFGLSIPVCGMVKDDAHRTRGVYYNNIEIPVDTHSEGFQLVTRIQDEAHRFAIEYHRSLRGKSQVRSVLDEIPGIGDKRRRALLRRFKTVEAIRAAGPEELAAVEGMNRPAARAVYDFFHGGVKSRPAEVVEELG